MFPTPETDTPSFPAPAEPASTPAQSEEQKSITANLAAVGDHDTTDFNQAAAVNLQAINEGKEDILRQKAAIQEQNTKRQSLIQLQQDSLNVPYPNAGLTKTLLQMSYGDLSPYALEHNAVTGIQNAAAADPHTGAAISMGLGDGEKYDSIRDYAYKTLTLNKEMDKIQTELDGQGALSKLGTTTDAFIGNMMDLLPFRDIAASEAIKQGTNLPENLLKTIMNPAGSVKDSFDYLFSPNVTREQYDALLPKIVSAVKTAALNNPEMVKETLAHIHGFNTSDVINSNIVSAASVAGLASEGMSALARKPLSLMDVLGNRDMASNVGANKLLEELGAQVPSAPGIVSSDEAIANGMPGVGSHAPFDKPWVGNTTAVNKAVENMTAVSARADDLIQVNRLSPTQEYQAVQDATAEVTRRYGKLNLLDTRTVGDPAIRLPQALGAHSLETGEDLANTALNTPTEPTARDRELAGQYANEPPEPTLRYKITKDPEALVNRLSFFVGPDSGENGFLSEFAAKEAQQAKGLSGGKIVGTTDGKYAIQVDHDVAENGFYEPELDEKAWRSANVVSRFVRNSDNISVDEFSGARHLATETQNRLQKEVLNPLSQPIKNLGGQGRKNLITMMKLSGDQESFFSHSDYISNYEKAFGRTPTDKEAIAYRHAVEINNLDYKLRNLEAYTTNVRNGLETIQVSNDKTGFNSLERNARIVKEPDFNKIKVFESDSSKHWAPGERTEELDKLMGSGNYHVVEFHGDLPSFDDEPIKYAIAHKRSTEISPLSRRQVGYQEGFHREYKGDIFAKQANTGTYKDGAQWIGNPHTHAVFGHYDDAHTWVDRANQGLKSYRDFNAGRISEAEHLATLEATPFKNPETIDNLIREKRLSPEHDFEVTDDKELPSLYSQSGRQFIGDSDMGGQDQWLNTQGRMYYSHKGTRLMGPQDEPAALVDPLKTLDRAVRNAIRIRSFGNYNKYVQEEWLRTAAPHLKPVEGASPLEMFMHGEYTPEMLNSNRRLMGALETNRQVIKRFMNTKTDLQKGIDVGLRELRKNMDMSGVPKALVAPVKFAQKGNPLNLLTTSMFDAWQGSFNLAQFPLQAQQAMIAMSMSPKWGAQAVADTFHFNRALATKDPNILDWIAKNGVHGFEPEDYKLMLKTYARMGLDRPGSDINGLEQYGNSIGSSPFVVGFNNFREWGRVFFNQAERLNRQVAWKIAWKDASERYPTVAKDSSEFAQKVSLHASDYEGNMRSASKPFWNQGVLKIPTQYLRWQVHSIENMLPKVVGGNPRLSAKAKMGQAAGHLFFTGIHGALGASIGGGVITGLGTAYKFATGTDMPQGMQTTLERGFWDSMVDGLTNLDTDFSYRQGLGQAIEDTVNKLTGGHGQTFLSVLGGPSDENMFKFGDNVFDSTVRIVQYLKSEQTDMLPKEVLNEYWNDIVPQVGTLSTAQKAYWIWNYGQIKDPSTGKPMIDGINKWQAIPEVFGFKDAREVELYRQGDLLAQRSEQIKEMSKLVAKNREEVAKALMDGDEKQATYLQTRNSALYQGMRSDPMMQTQVFQAADDISRKTNDSWTQMKDRVYKNTGKVVQ